MTADSTGARISPLGALSSSQIASRITEHLVRLLHREWTRSLAKGRRRRTMGLGDGADLDDLAIAAEELFAKT